VVLLGPDDGVIAGWAFDRVALDTSQPYLAIHLSRLPLRPGVYRWQFALFDDGSERTGGRLLEQWTALPELRVGGTPFGHPQDTWAGWLNVRADLRVPGLEVSGTAVGSPEQSRPRAQESRV
jgi:hypothetical protein